MIETARSIAIDTDIGTTWDYVQDIRRWSNLFPGCESCTVIDDNDSRWVIKVGAGGLVRTVHVNVHVDRWAGPEHVDFSFRLEAEPVTGSGSYRAVSTGEHNTEIARRAGDWILAQRHRTYNGPAPGKLDRYHYSTYYCSQAMFQLGGEYWFQFFPGLLDVLVENQNADGSWDAESNRNDYKYGSVYSTALTVLTLTPPYQLLPIYQR